MKQHFLKFDSKEQYEQLILGVQWPIETSVIFPVISELAAETPTNEEGEVYKETRRKDGFFLNCLGDYPEILSGFEIEVENPSYIWA